MKKTVAFIIPNYNGEEILSRNIPKVIKAAGYYGVETGTTVEIIIVDDCSVDNSKKVINKLRSENYMNVNLRLLDNKVNKGFSPTVNKGVKASDADIVILLNTDAYPEDPRRFVKSFIDLFDDKNLFAVGFMDKSIEPDGSTVLRGRGLGYWTKGFLNHSKGDVNNQNTLWVSGGSSAFDRSKWNELSGMNELYAPFYWEDIDLSYRALKCGYKIMFFSKSIIVHEHEKGAIKSTRTADEVKKISYRNQIFFSWLNLTDNNLIFAHVLYLPLHLFRALIKGDFVFWGGFFQAISRLSDVIKYRSSFNSKFKYSDEKVIKLVNKE